jgi:predicted transcriptional regulator
MPGLFKSDEEVEELLSHRLNLTRVANIGGPDRSGKREGIEPRGETKSLDEKVRIGTLARLIGKSATGELLDLDTSQVSKYARGNGSHSNRPDGELKEKIEDNLAPIRSRALANVEFLLDVVAEKASKMNGSKASQAAKNMVEVYDKLGPKGVVVNLNTPQVVFYAPRVLESHDYPVIEVEAS